ncbi:MAG: 30S ribosomal protein S1 [Acidobacteria bacterium]|nr:30S ribosomal protein S1 [Acidobacteriota bacterium]
MSDPHIPESSGSDAGQSFGNMLADFERGQRQKQTQSSQRQGTVIAVSGDSVFFDIGYKTEGVLPLAEFQRTGESVKPGDKIPVSIKGRDPEGYYQLSRLKITQPTDWDSLQRAFNEKSTIVGTVTGVVKGGVSVDIGVRAFMPASRTGTRDAGELEKLVEQEVRCRIIKLDVADEDVVVDRRAVLEEEERASKEHRYAQLKEGDVVSGEVRSLADYGAFIDLGGIDGLLHVGEISWGRVNKPADVLSVGQTVEARVLKIDRDKQRISLSLKSLQPQPWDSISERYKVADRVRGVVTRVLDFGAFVELEPGIEGLIHVSEMSWIKKVRSAGDVLKPGETVEAVILGINKDERRISLGLKQALGDPWADAERRFAPGATVEGPITSITNFGAFVQAAEGVEGMIHVSEISAERRINHPRDVLRLGQIVKAQVLAIDTQKRQLRLSMKQLVPSSIDEYIAEHKHGDTISGRVVEVGGDHARVELGEGIQAQCRLSAAQQQESNSASNAAADLSALTSMLSAKWKSGTVRGSGKNDAVTAGQVRSFRVTKLDPAQKLIELEMV